MLNFPQLVDELRNGFLGDCYVPERQHIDWTNSGDNEPNLLLLMPAIKQDDRLIVKLVCVAPQNKLAGEPTIQGTLYLADALSGSPIAMFDASEITKWRTAAASALAASYLARPESKSLTVVGNGALAPYLIRAHCSMSSITELRIWGRSAARSELIAEDVSPSVDRVIVTDDLKEAVTHADIVTCVTMSREPLIFGRWLKPGQHLDLVGSYKKSMREVDREAMKVASIYIDTEAATREAGELWEGLEKNDFTRDDIRGDLFDLCRGKVNGRSSDSEITVFKSVGHALEDFATARLLERILDSQPEHTQ